jgi:hypothetical protein
MSGLRERALTLIPSEIGAAPSNERPNVWGLLMETGHPQGAASLVTFADGSTSLYFSNGGGVIGAGEHAPVRATAEAFLSAAEAQLEEFERVDEFPLPELGRVRFYVRTFSDVLAAEADEQDLGHNRHKLSSVFHAGHAVIAAVRQATPK